MDYIHFLTIVGAAGIIIGMTEVDELIDEALDMEPTSKGFGFFIEHYVLTPIAPAALAVLALFWANSIIGYLHWVATPIGIFVVTRWCISRLSLLFLGSCQSLGWPPMRIRRLATFLGVTIGLASCVAVFEADPCGGDEFECIERDY